MFWFFLIDRTSVQIKAKVEPGVCGFITDVEAEVRDYQFVTLKVNSACENIIKIAELLKELIYVMKLKMVLVESFIKLSRKTLRVVAPDVLFQSVCLNQCRLQ